MDEWTDGSSKTSREKTKKLCLSQVDYRSSRFGDFFSIVRMKSSFLIRVEFWESFSKVKWKIDKRERDEFLIFVAMPLGCKNFIVHIELYFKVFVFSSISKLFYFIFHLSQSHNKVKNL